MQIAQLRLSLIWTESFPHLLDDVARVNPNYAFLGQSTQYIERFERVQKDVRQVPFRRVAMGDLHPPWPGPWGQRFWLYYLAGRTPGLVSGATAWNALVPFRGRTPVDISARWLQGSLYHETFYYPHGIAFVLTANIRPARTMSLGETVKAARDVRRDRRFRVSFGDSEESLTAERVAEHVLAHTRSSVLAAETPRPDRIWEPFTIVTVITGTGVDLEKPTPLKTVGALDAMTSWRRGANTGSSPKLSDANRLPPGAPDSVPDLVFAGHRGRAVWFPQLFASNQKRKALSCFHRNLTLLTVQVESLGGLIRLASRHLEAGDDIPVRMHECVFNALRELDDLDEGRRNSTYRSHSPHHQLESNDVISIMKGVREFLA